MADHSPDNNYRAPINTLHRVPARAQSVRDPEFPNWRQKFSELSIFLLQRRQLPRI